MDLVPGHAVVEVPTEEFLSSFSLEELQIRLAEIKRRIPYARDREESSALSRTILNIESVIYDKRAEVERLERFERNVQRFIANRIKLARIEARLTQEMLGRVVEISQCQLSRMEAGTRRVSVAELIRFAIALRRPLAYFTYPSDEAVIGTGWEPIKEAVG